MKRGLVPLLVLLLLNLVVWTKVSDLSRATPLEVTFLDVGQGDAMLIEIDGVYQILIDGGPGRTVLRKLSQELSFGDRDVDLILITHSDRDHLEGALHVLDNYKVEHVVYNRPEEDTKLSGEWSRRLNEQDIDVVMGVRGDRIIVGGATIEVLYPTRDRTDGGNKNSIVTKLSYKDVSLLFTGDIRVEEEEELEGVDSDVLKVAHHGSKTSTSQFFLASVSPEIAVIGVGESNTYGHPHSDVLSRLHEIGASVFRTDEDGDVKILSDGRVLITE